MTDAPIDTLPHGREPGRDREPTLKRPTEAVAGLGLGGTLYGFLTQAEWPKPWAGAVALVVILVPYVVSFTVDVLRDNRDAEQLENELTQERRGTDFE